MISREPSSPIAGSTVVVGDRDNNNVSVVDPEDEAERKSAQKKASKISTDQRRGLRKFLQERQADSDFVQ